MSIENEIEIITEEIVKVKKNRKADVTNELESDIELAAPELAIEPIIMPPIQIKTPIKIEQNTQGLPQSKPMNKASPIQVKKAFNQTQITNNDPNFIH
jgi:hypothetical protein